MATADEFDLRDEDRLPWLDTVETDEPDGVPIGRVLGFVVLGLAILAALIFAIFKISQPAAPHGDGAMIAAQPGDYKVKPDDPGGLKVGGEGDSAIATSAGAGGGNGAIDLNAVPEKPVVAAQQATPAKPDKADAATRHAEAAVPATGGRLAAAPPLTAPPAKIPGAGSGGSMVQLGAFPSQAAANGAWSAMAKRFSYVATLDKSVEQASVNGHTVYRLRVNAGSAGAATDVCGRLKVAGESCFVVTG